MAELLGELAARTGQRILAAGELALGDRPGALVLARPQRPAHVTEQHLERAVALAKQDDAGGGRHRRGRYATGAGAGVSAGGGYTVSSASSS
jgi:hypothetical protein